MSRSLRRSEEVLNRCAVHSSRCPYMHVRAVWAYNARPQWLADAHAALDATVAVAYGWDADISDEEALSELLTLISGSTKMWAV